MSEYEQVEFASAAELRRWLAENHATSAGVWAVYGKKNAGERWVPYEQVVRQALCFGWVDIRGRGLDETRTQMLLTPRRARSNWSESNRGRVAELEATVEDKSQELSNMAGQLEDASMALQACAKKLDALPLVTVGGRFRARESWCRASTPFNSSH